MSEETDDLKTAPRPTVRVVRVVNFIDEAQLKKDMGYSLADLSTAMMDQASLLVHYGVLQAKASKQVDDMKMLLENAEAAVYRRLRDTAATAGEKITEAQLEKAVARHPQVVAYKRAVNEAKQVESVAKIAVEGFKHRKDMLVQHGATSREEMKGEVRIAMRNANEDQLDGLKDRFLNRARLAAE